MSSKHYVVGCLYDLGPECVERKRDAIDILDRVVCAGLSGRARRRIRGWLRRTGIYYFNEAERRIVGHDYCEVSEHPGPCPEDP